MVGRRRDENMLSRGEDLLFGGDDGKDRGSRPMRAVIILLCVIACLLVLALLVFLVLSSTSAFTISAIDASATAHLSSDDIAKLASVEEGTTLLSIDENKIVANLRRNPWVSDVRLTREFPDSLKIEVSEREVDCLVKMSTASVCWCLGDDEVWIEPINLQVKDGQSADDAALLLAQDMDTLLIVDMPTNVSPVAGEEASDDVLKAVNSYREQLSPEFVANVVRYRASSVESIGVTLSSGVEVSFGAASEIPVKEAIVSELLAKHPNQITFINVRVPSQPTYRKVGSESVTQGTGVVVNPQGNPAQDPSKTTTGNTQDDKAKTDGQPGGDVTEEQEEETSETEEEYVEEPVEYEAETETI